MSDQTPYTPSLEDVADSWRRGRVWQLGSAVGVRSEFDRFIAQVRAEAWEHGAKDMMRAIGDEQTVSFIAPHNPYREGQ